MVVWYGYRRQTLGAVVMLLWPALLLLLLLLQLVTCQSAVHMHTDYIVVGAGPAGLQMGYFLQQAGRQYVILERGNVSGNFFQTFPRHDRLISINKRHTGKTNKEFNLRHDWNSLISDDDSLLFSRFSKKFFPDRRDMLRYLGAYSEKLGLNVQYNTEVMNISKVEDTASARKAAGYSMMDQHGHQYSCRYLLVATGMWKGNVPDIRGLNFTEGYEDVSTDPEDFDGKNVLILGNGNSAFETADAIYGSANVVHIAGRSRIRLAWETHYVGDLRGVNNGILDTYQLKSLDGLLEGDLSDLHLFPDGDRIKVKVNVVEADNFALRESYDKVIRCLGFTFDDSLFNKNSRPRPAKAAKFPLIEPSFQVFGHRDMYILGAASHSLDFRASAGGFIHGFRYTVRALHHLLEWQNHGIKWPAKELPITALLNTVVKRMNEASGLYQMFGELADVVAFHGDRTRITYIEEFPVQLLPRFEEMTGHRMKRCIVLVMQYGTEYSGAGRDVFFESRSTAFAHEAHHSNFLHPVFYYYNSTLTETTTKDLYSKWSLPRPKRLHHVVEDFLTTWTSPVTHVLPLRRFLEYSVKTDLRNFFHTDCFILAMTHKNTPLSCHFNSPLMF